MHVAAVCRKLNMLQLMVVRSSACLLSPVLRLLLKQGCFLSR
jgi:hypothetical protein